MNDEEIRCPRCGAARPSGGHCPNCGYGGDEPDVFLLGSPTADGVAAVAAGVLPMVLFVLGFFLSLGGQPGFEWLSYAGEGLLLLDLLAFFTLLRPFQTVRRALATTFCLYTLPGALVSLCLVLIGPGQGIDRLTVSLISLGLLLLQGALFFTAFRRR